MKQKITKRGRYVKKPMKFATSVVGKGITQKIPLAESSFTTDNESVTTSIIGNTTQTSLCADDTGNEADESNFDNCTEVSTIVPNEATPENRL